MTQNGIWNGKHRILTKRGRYMQNTKHTFLPELLRFADGTEVTSAADWEARRHEIRTLLEQYEYGVTPPYAGATVGEVTKTVEKCAAGHGVQEELKITFPTSSGDFSFPAHFFYPSDGKPHFTFVMLNFRPDAYDQYCPVEEIIDNGFGVAIVYYESVTSDSGAEDGLAACYPRREDGTDWGKLGMWAFAASRLGDYLLTRKEVSALGVVGHSRLGKTALWCGAQDERFQVVCSNDSGCCGAAYEREKHGNSETVKAITEEFPHWFCKNFLAYAKAPDERPFDQHFLLAMMAPRRLCIGSASLDDWADQYGEQLSCIGASPAWKLLGCRGFVGKETPASVGETMSDGEVQYHLRDGLHFFSRNDWAQYMNAAHNAGF